MSRSHRRVDSCLQPLASVPGKALVYCRHVFLCPSHPQIKLERGCTFHLFSDVEHTGHLPVSVAWEQAAEKHRAAAPALRESRAIPRCPSAGKDHTGMALLYLVPGHDSISSRLKHILIVFLNQNFFDKPRPTRRLCK